jgi:hypothetical protein
MNFKNFIKKSINVSPYLFQPIQQWNIDIIDKPIQSFLFEKEYEVEWFPKLDRRHFLADPFGGVINGVSYIFMEEHDYRKRNNIISYVKLTESNNLSKIATAIEKPYPMSYPYIFYYRNGVFCIPETRENNEATIYKIEDPSNWEKKHTIIKGIDVVDPSLIEYKGKWWIFFTVGSDPTSLHLWYSEDLFGKWKPHKKNPIKTDKGSSRPAGTLFFHKGVLYRPSQDCSESYGAKIVINKILRISPTEFHEEAVSTINPNQDNISGIHTLSSFGDITLIDGVSSIGRDFLWLKNKSKSIIKYSRKFLSQSTLS